MLKLYCTTGTAKVFMADILFYEFGIQYQTHTPVGLLSYLLLHLVMLYSISYANS